MAKKFDAPKSTEVQCGCCLAIFPSRGALLDHLRKYEETSTDRDGKPVTVKCADETVLCKKCGFAIRKTEDQLQMHEFVCGGKLMTKEGDDVISSARPKTFARHIAKEYFADAVRLPTGISFLLVKKDGTLEVKDQLVSEDGAVIKPISPDEDSRLVAMLPSMPQFPPPVEDAAAAFTELKAAIAMVWDANSNENLELVALWVCGTYRAELVGTFPYMRFRGPFGSGKTRGLDVVAHLALRPLAVGPNLSQAVIFRMCEQYGPTLCANEFDEKGEGDYGSMMVQLLNSRYERGHPISRIGGEDRDKIQLFDPFGPTSFSARAPFTDSSLESRCFEVVCEETDREDILALISPEDFEVRFVGIRERLYRALRLVGPEVQDPFPEMVGVNRRFKQAMTALWMCLPNALHPAMHALMAAMAASDKDKLANSEEGMLWQSIFNHMGSEPDFEITGAWAGTTLGLPEKNAARAGGRKLGAMGFYQHKGHRDRTWRCKRNLWKKMAARLGDSSTYPEKWQDGAATKPNQGAATLYPDGGDMRGDITDVRRSEPTDARGSSEIPHGGVENG